MSSPGGARSKANSNSPVQTYMSKCLFHTRCCASLASGGHGHFRLSQEGVELAWVSISSKPCGAVSASRVSQTKRPPSLSRSRRGTCKTLLMSSGDDVGRIAVSTLLTSAAAGHVNGVNVTVDGGFLKRIDF